MFGSYKKKYEKLLSEYTEFKISTEYLNDAHNLKINEYLKIIADKDKTIDALKGGSGFQTVVDFRNLDVISIDRTDKGTVINHWLINGDGRKTVDYLLINCDKDTHNRLVVEFNESI